MVDFAPVLPESTKLIKNTLYKIPANTLFIGKEFVFMPQCQSTNSEAIGMCSNKAVMEGTVIVTDHQLAGRGQRGNTWQSDEGKNLTFSVILNPTFLRLQDQFLLSIITSLAINDFLDALGVNSKIKWPNDVMVGEKKICGILVENQVNGNKLTNSIIGIGLNVNQEHLPIGTATSVKQITSKEYDLSILLTSLLEKLEARYLMLRSGNHSTLITRYESLMYWKGEEHSFSANGLNFRGEICGVDSNSGQLCIRTTDETIQFGIKQVTYLS